MQPTYYTRSSHGSHPVIILPDGDGYEVQWPQGAVRYSSARRTLIAITNRAPNPGSRAKDPKVPFNRYFRIGRYSEVTSLTVDTLTLFSPVQSPTLYLPSKTLGIDLVKRGHEVAKLFYAGFAYRVVAEGHDPEEVLQEVFKGILIRNKGKCPWDSEKSSFGHYVHMICNCIVINYHKRWGRVYGEEQYGVRSVDGTIVDLGSSDTPSFEATPEDCSRKSMVLRAISDEAISFAYDLGADPDLTVKCVEALASGFKKSDLETAFCSKHRPFQVDKAYRAARQAARKILLSA